MEKLCKDCQENKSISDYYIAYKNNDKLIYTSRCKPCHNKFKTEYNRSKPKVIKPNSFEKLHIDKRCQILEDVKNNIKFKEISRKHDIAYNKIIFWKNKGYLAGRTELRSYDEPPEVPVRVLSENIANRTSRHKVSVGALAGKKKNKWLQHVAKVREKNKDMKYTDVLKLASKSYL